ncbi:hypothetical protein OG418_19510 [Streptomyces phaeochromogenes]|uniref:Uncharacterized protein n=1 Tax=Streptomyces phaeochromogenes TaxID=1923 RepID=A0ABZ1HK84_STRPH|nr:hypothetical protein [Streptomyces phaeochromogenes]WSD17665.1 hypothetical protein OHB35_33020 [Streptomyces phaeochromogenes]
MPAKQLGEAETCVLITMRTGFRHSVWITDDRLVRAAEGHHDQGTFLAGRPTTARTCNGVDVEG